jgi:hypothetical protein
MAFKGWVAKPSKSGYAVTNPIYTTYQEVMANFYTYLIPMQHIRHHHSRWATLSPNPTYTTAFICFCLLFSGCTRLELTDQFNKGYAYSTGQGVPQNEVKAVEWYRKSAEQNYAPAEFMLGLAYETGRP